MANVRSLHLTVVVRVLIPSLLFGSTRVSWDKRARGCTPGRLPPNSSKVEIEGGGRGRTLILIYLKSGSLKFTPLGLGTRIFPRSNIYKPIVTIKIVCFEVCMLPSVRKAGKLRARPGDPSASPPACDVSRTPKKARRDGWQGAGARHPRICSCQASITYISSSPEESTCGLNTKTPQCSNDGMAAFCVSVSDSLYLCRCSSSLPSVVLPLRLRLPLSESVSVRVYVYSSLV